MQVPEQDHEHRHRPHNPTGNPKWLPGVSQNPRGRESKAQRQVRIENKARELAVEFGGFEAMSAVDQVLLTQAAIVLLRRPKSAEDVVRCANSVQRLLGGLAKRYGLDRKRVEAPESYVALSARVAAEADERRRRELAEDEARHQAESTDEAAQREAGT